MKTEYTYFVGVDVSKSWLDFSLIQEGKELKKGRVNNNLKGVREILEALKEQGVTTVNTLFIAEHTGSYSDVLSITVASKKYKLWMVTPLELKLNSGTQRGKSDPLDAFRMADFCMRHHDKAKLWKVPSKTMRYLKKYQAQRKALIKARHCLLRSLDSLSEGTTKQMGNDLKRNFNKSIKALEADLKKLDIRLEELIRNDEELKRLVELATSVPGIGETTAIALLIATAGFTKFQNAKQLACYAGVVPFSYSSGSSIRGTGKVSKKSDKLLKCLLYMGVRSVIQIPGELQEYYYRKIKEGKHHMSVVNAIKNKLILRVFACVRDDVKYDKNYSHSLA
ncbi:IS110 family transposase [Algivirga pacifica]|uniref:IS110 family transposase n=1 Tax=Algivirga pacifica TaxID=1162670 RepID=A0ABP9DFP4_9BACT